MKFLILGLMFCSAYGSTVAETHDQRLENLQAFTHLYGYVRYFHPSDEARPIDWDKFAVYGAAQ